jgi:hypothetical protein
MPISIDTLRNASYRFKPLRARNLIEARAQRLKTVFLCHSHKDEQLVRGVIAMLEEAGWRVYVDWADASMPDSPTKQTAEKIKLKITDHDYFLILATANSMASRWCPWEIGYADGKKQIDQILLFPTTEGTKVHGNEYLQLYRRIDLSTANKLCVWQPSQNENGILIEKL